MRIGILDSYERGFRPFNENEAWTLFRLAAIGEGIGWALLLTGILISGSLAHDSEVPIKIAGQIHGMLFLLYLTTTALVYPSLDISRPVAVLAIMASVPPFGSIVFERSLRFHLEKLRLHQGLRVLVYSQVTARFEQRTVIQDSS